MVVRALSVGKPLVVNDLGWFSELPDAVALKVPADEQETNALDEALETLAADPGLRERMAAAAVELARTEHDLDHAADLYVAALEEAAGLESVERAVVRDVAKLVRAGRRPGLRGAGDAAGRLREVGLGRTD